MIEEVKEPAVTIRKEIIQKIDEFCHQFDQKIVKRMEALWNYEAYEDEKTLEEVGKKFSLSRQRIQQNKEKFINRLKNHFAHRIQFYESTFLDKLLKHPKPITLAATEITKRYYYNFYEAVLSEVLLNVPVANHLMNGLNQQNFRRSKKRTSFEKYLISKIDSLKPRYKTIKIYDLWVHFEEKTLSVSEKLLVFKFILSLDNLFIKQIDEEYYLLQTGKLFEEIAAEILEKSERPLSREEIVEIVKQDLEKNYLYDKNSTLNRLLNKKEILRIEEDLFGLKKHLSYNELEWQNILTESNQFLERLGRQVYISEIYQQIKVKYPALRSYYELASILSFSNEIVHLGEYNFALKKRKLKRILLKDLIKQLVTDPNKKYHIDEVYSEIKKYRYVHRNGLRTILSKQNYLVEEDSFIRLK